MSEFLKTIGVLRFESPSNNALGIEAFLGMAGDLDKLTAAQIAHVFAHAKSEYDDLEDRLSQLKAFVELIKTVKLPEAFDREQIKTFTLQDGTRVTKSDRTFASIPAEVKSEAYDWLRSNGADNLIVETVNASTLSSFAKSVMAGELSDQEIFDLPEELFRVEIRPTTSVTKGKK